MIILPYGSRFLQVHQCLFYFQHRVGPSRDPVEISMSNNTSRPFELASLTVFRKGFDADRIVATVGI